jgi:glyceraldehyde 3-phosphate dehydrogenase
MPKQALSGGRLTGALRGCEDVSGHLSAGVRFVILSADSSDADVVIVPGINGAALDPSRHAFIAMASWTTNATARGLRILEEAFGSGHLRATTPPGAGPRGQSARPAAAGGRRSSKTD